MLRHTLVETASSRDGARALRRPNGVEILLPALKRLQEERGIPEEVQERVLRAHGLDLEGAAERGDSLLVLCNTKVGVESGRHTGAYKQLKRMLEEDLARNRVVRHGFQRVGAEDHPEDYPEAKASTQVLLAGLPPR